MNNEDIKRPYASSLLSLATGKHILNGSHLSFGEGNVRGRIKNLLNYKKPRFWIVVISIIVVIVVGIGLMANPLSKEEVGDRNGEAADRNLKTDDIAKFVEENLKVIMSSPKESSNPQDYLNAHKNTLKFVQQENKILTLDEVIELSKKGQDLKWSDFKGYEYFDVGSGLYIHIYVINEVFSLRIGGFPGDMTDGELPDESWEPMYFYLVANNKTEEKVDIRTEDVERFIEEHATQ